MSNQINLPEQGINARAKVLAQEAAGAWQRQTTDLVEFQSQGRVVVIGGPEALEFATRLRPPLRAQVLLTEGEELPGVPLISQGGRSLSVSGHLGAFTIQLGEPGQANAERLQADLVLDLGEQPQLSMPMKPPGYLVSTIDEPNLVSALEQLEQLVGVFDKPRYFSYDPSLCAHGRSGRIACTRCIDSCPAEAISSLVEQVSVDSNLCQGGGVCATVCPSGAMRYSYPGAEDTLEQIRLLLKTYREQGGQEPILLFATHESPSLNSLPDNCLPVPLEELASAGLECWLAGLAYGAKAVLLLQDQPMPERVATAVCQQLQTVGEILAAMDYPSESVRLIESVDDIGIPAADLGGFKAANFSSRGGKRQVAFMAIDHLHSQAPRSKPLANLSVGAPFGTAQVDESSCTLCFACVSACPGKALMTGEGVPQLRFIEANCLQCGMCTRTCPEQAIWINPRLLFDSQVRTRTRVLHEEPPFACVECGKPFATRSVINNMLGKLEGHWMYQNERARRRLQMCDECRVVDIAQDPAAMDQGMLGETLQ